MTDKQLAVVEWLKQFGIVDDISEDEHRELLSLIGHKGFGLLYGLLMRDRAGWVIQLSNIALADGQKVAAASVLQGQIRAVDRLREIVLNIADPAADQTPAQAAEQEQQSNG
jgi:hypothetical protein